MLLFNDYCFVKTHYPHQYKKLLKHIYKLSNFIYIHKIVNNIKILYKTIHHLI
jgi:hypothetical protein